MNPLDRLPDFEVVTYLHIQKPAAAKLIAWDKAQESERRMTFYEFVERNLDLAKPKRTLLDDALAAFLLTFEAAMQHAKSQVIAAGRIPKFDDWLQAQTEYDVLFRGLRSLRHLQAHVEAYGASQNRVVVLQKLSDSFTRWSMQRLSPADLARLERSPLKPEHLADWQTLVESNNTVGLMSQGLGKLNNILTRLEPLV